MGIISARKNRWSICVRQTAAVKRHLQHLCAPWFYGLGSARTRKNLEEVPRKKYKPWQQGTWGGWIRFAAGTKQYRIERTFSEKEREDTFALIDLDTGMVSQDYTENIGEELFGMTKATYQATAFMSWNHMRVEVNENMRIGFFDGTQDTGLLKSKQAAAAIEAEYREYKKTGNRGELAAGYGRIKPSFHAGVGA